MKNNNFNKTDNPFQTLDSAILVQILPEGKIQGDEFVLDHFKNPNAQSDEPVGSLKININTWSWLHAGTDTKGAGIISFYAFVKGIKLEEAAKELVAMMRGRHE